MTTIPTISPLVSPGVGAEPVGAEPVGEGDGEADIVGGAAMTGEREGECVWTVREVPVVEAMMDGVINGRAVSV